MKIGYGFRNLTPPELIEISIAYERRAELRKELAALSDRALAKKYNVSRTTISRATGHRR